MINLRPLKNISIVTSLIPLFLLIQGCTGSGLVGQNNSPTISVGASAEILVPADVINLSVTIGISAESAEKAFARHQEQESFIAGLLHDLNIDEEKITFQPMSIRPNRQRDGTILTNTSQRISIKMDDFDSFIDVQKKLIDNGFDNFSANFFSTEFEEGGKEALVKAVEHAREDAEIMAAAAGSRLGEVIKIEHASHESRRPTLRTEMSAAMVADSRSMMDFAQTITVRKEVVVVFKLIN